MNIALMFDAESLDITPNAALLSVGAVAMDMDRLAVLTDHSAYCLIDTQDCMNHGMTVSFDTIQWWMRQDRRAISEAFDTVSRLRLADAADYFETFVKRFGDVKVWSCGSRDFNWLETMFKAAGKPVPWRFNQIRDYRTMREQFGHMVMAPDNTLGHHALCDAIWQAEHLMRIMRELRDYGDKDERF